MPGQFFLFCGLSEIGILHKGQAARIGRNWLRRGELVASPAWTNRGDCAKLDSGLPRLSMDNLHKEEGQ
ncbi:hypothetical protein J31TS4_33270 [Paenibacillus sp. J31TS4]|nr:hypothetical protein J31TS4_33270 [Paenibacillus sp. J31TS4]